MTGNTGGNRQDNRQRGNAAQLLEKYKSMARDAQLAGDRVQTEYFLQFADHYFRVLDDGRARFDEQRRTRGDDDNGDDGDEDDRLDGDSSIDGDDDGDGDEQSQPQQQPRRQARPASDRPNDRSNERQPDRQAERPAARRDRPNGRVRDDEGRGPARDEDAGQRIDYAVLPPAIRTDDNDSADRVADEEDAPRPRRRVRRPRADEAGGDDSPTS